MSTTPINLLGVLKEAIRIIGEHTLHFLTLTLLFLVPFSLSLYLLFTLLLTSPFTLTFYLSLFISFLTLLASVSSITFSSYNALRSRKLILSTPSFLPLLSAFSYPLLYLLIAGFFTYLYSNAPIPYENPYFVAISITVAVLLPLLLIYLSADWVLIGAVVVIEGGRGRHALDRSRDLVSGAKWTAVWLFFLYGFCGVSQTLSTVFGLVYKDSTTPVTMDFIVKIIGMMVVGVFFCTYAMLLLIVGSTVLYLQCKVARGELEDEIVEEGLSNHTSIFASKPEIANIGIQSPSDM